MWPKLGQSDCLAKPWNVLCSGGGLGRAAPAALFSSCHCDHSCCLLFPSNLSFCSSSVCSENFPLFSVQFSCSVVSDSSRPHESARQTSLSITNSQSLPKPMSIESVMPSNHLILYRPLLLLPSIFLNIRVFQMSQLFASVGQSIGVSASKSVLPMNTQDWSPLGWTGWISLQSKGLSKSLPQHYSSKASILRHSAFFIVRLSHPYMTTEKTIALTQMDLCRPSNVSAF